MRQARWPTTRCRASPPISSAAASSGTGAAPDPFALGLPAGVAIWAATAVLLLALNPARAGDELLGVRGAALSSLCFAAVFLSGQVNVSAGPARIARWLGDITYGCYLLHPLLFFGFAWFVLPRLGVAEVEQLPLAARWAVLSAVLALSCAGAAASERWFEAPLRRWGKRRLGRGNAPAPYKDAASISS